MIEPLYNNVLVEPLELELTTKGGIVIQEQGTRALKIQKGRVVAVGKGMITPDGSLTPLHLKPGDTVLYIRGTGISMRYSIESPDYLMFKETELMGVLRDESV